MTKKIGFVIIAFTLSLSAQRMSHAVSSHGLSSNQVGTVNPAYNRGFGYGGHGSVGNSGHGRFGGYSYGAQYYAAPVFYSGGYGLPYFPTPVAYTSDPYPQSPNGGGQTIIFLPSPQEEQKVVYIPSYMRPSNGPSLAELAKSVRENRGGSVYRWSNWPGDYEKLKKED